MSRQLLFARGLNLQITGNKTKRKRSNSRRVWSFVKTQLHLTETNFSSSKRNMVTTSSSVPRKASRPPRPKRLTTRKTPCKNLRIVSDLWTRTQRSRQWLNSWASNRGKQTSPSAPTRFLSFPWVRTRSSRQTPSSKPSKTGRKTRRTGRCLKCDSLVRISKSMRILD